MPDKDLPFSPFVNKLLAAKRSAPVFVTRGYLGEGDKNVVRLYFDLSLETYAEIPRSAVMHADTVAGSPHQRAELIVDARQDIRVVSVLERTLKAADLQEAMDHAKAHKTAPDPCAAPPFDGGLLLSVQVAVRSRDRPDEPPRVPQRAGRAERAAGACRRGGSRVGPRSSPHRGLFLRPVDLPPRLTRRLRGRRWRLERWTDV